MDKRKPTHLYILRAQSNPARCSSLGGGGAGKRLCISSLVFPSLSGLGLEWVSQVCSLTSGCREDARAMHPQADATVLQELLL